MSSEPRDDFVVDPDTCEHEWSEWKLGPMFKREERFCDRCGSMEWQRLEGVDE
jgi:hypothetical protein